MNVMYEDRQYLLVPAAKGLCLVERLMLGNAHRKSPYDLWFIDQRTIKAHEHVLTEHHDIKQWHSWAFYMPTRECPLGYRELSLWFMLVSLSQTKKKRYTQEAFAGLEALIGLGARQASVLADNLVDAGIIKMIRTEGWPWFYVYDTFAAKADWFVPLHSRAVPTEFLEMENAERAGRNAAQMEAQPVEPKKEMTLEEIKVMKNKHVCDAVKRLGYEAAKRWWSMRPDKTQEPSYDEEDAMVIRQMESRIQKEESDDERRNEQPSEQPADDTDDDFLRKLQEM